MNAYFENEFQIAVPVFAASLLYIFLGLGFFLVSIYLLSAALISHQKLHAQLAPLLHAEAAATTTENNDSLYYQFKTDGILNESGSMNQSTSPYFWLNSGGMLVLTHGIGMTIQGTLGPLQVWRMLYAQSDPLDTDGGKYPQNLFRLVTKGNFDNAVESLRFKITKLNMTNTPNRGAYSGVLLFSRYHDEMNLYYAGIRMDGTAVIKKKYKGIYYTLASAQVFPAQIPYNKYTNPNLIPVNVWIGLKIETKTVRDGSVSLTVWIDKNDSGDWEQVASALDVAGNNGNGVLQGPAHAGIRTDYLDVQFDDYRIEPQRDES